ncbi:hypothetical protein [Vreelandella sulfidaeris]|uniref:hypothetical protein n=1 Tax=Vreelandella sulfidaeris TaxID=115553 RepID=UPI0035E804B9
MFSNDVWLAWMKRYRAYILCLMVILSIFIAVLRFWGEWKYFFGMLIGQLFFGQAVQSYLYGKYISFGGGGVTVESSPCSRLVAFIVAFIGYLVMFLFNGYPWS